MVRLLLDILGDIDYGIYNVVGGFVMLFSFIVGSLSSSCQRFFSYYLGLHDYISLNKALNINKIIFYSLSIIIILLIVFFGSFFVQNYLVIPYDRLESSVIVLYISIFSFAISLISVPYISLIVSNENMGVYSLVSVLEVLVKLLLVLLLKYEVVYFDKLICYAIIMFIAPFLSFIIYCTYSRIKYQYVRFSFVWDKEMVKKILSYNGWHLLGTISVTFKGQGVNILINMFFTPVINTARSIAYQVNSGISTLAVNFFSAVKPQIYKSFSQNNIKAVNKLILGSSKLTFFLILILAIPFYLEIDYILNLWLTHVPEYTILFTKLIIINSLIDSISEPLIAGVLATGKVKRFEIIVGLIIFSNFGISYILLSKGYGPEYTMITSILISIIAHFTRLVFVNKLLSVQFRDYFIVLLRLLSTVFVSSILVYISTVFCETGFLKLSLTICFSTLIVILTMYALGLNKQERQIINIYISKLYEKIKKVTT